MSTKIQCREPSIHSPYATPLLLFLLATVNIRQLPADIAPQEVVVLEEGLKVTCEAPM